MIRLHDDIFFGIYSYLLKAEGGSKNEISFYFAYSTVFALIFFQILVLSSFIMLSGGFHIQGQEKLAYGLMVVLFLFVVNWLAFLRGDRYAKLISKYFKEKPIRRNLAKSRTTVFVSLVFLQFLIVVVVKIIQFI